MKKLLLVALVMIPAALLARVEPREGEEPISAERQITIVNDQDKVMHVHQLNGKVYGIRVEPTNGKPYNLVDPNGEGDFIRNAHDKILVPEWVLIKW